MKTSKRNEARTSSYSSMVGGFASSAADLCPTHQWAQISNPEEALV